MTVFVVVDIDGASLSFCFLSNGPVCWLPTLGCCCLIWVDADQCLPLIWSLAGMCPVPTPHWTLTHFLTTCAQDEQSWENIAYLVLHPVVVLAPAGNLLMMGWCAQWWYGVLLTLRTGGLRFGGCGIMGVAWTVFIL